jgi:hypothetical protein
MKKEYTYSGINFLFPVGKVGALMKQYAQEIEQTAPELEKIHFAVRKDEYNPRAYNVDLKVTSADGELLSTIETQNVPMGLEFLKRSTLERVLEEKKLNQINPKRKELFREPILKTAL